MRTAVPLFFLLLMDAVAACPSCTFLNLTRAVPCLLPWLLVMSLWLIIHEALRPEGMSLMECLIALVCLNLVSALGYLGWLTLGIPVAWWCYYGLSNFRAWDLTPERRRLARLNHGTALLFLLILVKYPSGVFY